MDITIFSGFWDARYVDDFFVFSKWYIENIRYHYRPEIAIIIVIILGIFVACAHSEYERETILNYCLLISFIALYLGIEAVDFCCVHYYDAYDYNRPIWWTKNILEISSQNYPFFIDALSSIFLLLTLFIFPFCFMALKSLSLNHSLRGFSIALLTMELLLVITFTTDDLLYFYVFFESLLIPMFILIGVWGARARKIKASYYFFLYTLFGSLIMLFGLIYLYACVGSTKYASISCFSFDADQQKLIWICFFLAFAVKMPMFPLHIWLPEAHVEAPTIGSMLLASLLLKLGGYGFIRFSISLFPAGSAYFSPLVLTMAVLGVVYGSLSTIRQVDMKRVVAYSSVAHMNLVVLGLFSNTTFGISGAVYLMVAHGVVSTALFFCVGVLYDRYHTRLLRYYGGLVTVMPLFCSIFFIFTLANMSFPGTSNFIGEFFVFLGIFSTNTVVFVLSATSIVFSAIYSVWLYNRIAFGTLKTKYIQRFTDLTLDEFSVLFWLLIPMLFLGLNGKIVFVFTDFALRDLLIF